jgi:hypothetical protein
MRARIKLKAGKLAVGFPAKRDEAVLNAGGSRSESVLFDFSQDGGAVGTLSLGRLLPLGAVVTEVIADEITNITSGGSATIKLTCNSQDLIDATAIASFAGLTKPALASSAAAIKISAEAELKLVIATAALTAGKLRLFVRYVLPND